MNIQIRIGQRKGDLPSSLIDDISSAVSEAGGQVHLHKREYSSRLRTPSWTVTTEIIVALGSAGVFTAIYQIICKFLEKNRDREIILERDKAKMTLKGHSLPEERELLKKLLPELMDRGTSEVRSSKDV